MISLRTVEEKPWISSAGGMPLERDLDMTHEPLRSRRVLLALRGLGLSAEVVDGTLDAREVEDLMEGVEGGESSKCSKSGSRGKGSIRVLDIVAAGSFRLSCGRSFSRSYTCAKEALKIRKMVRHL